MLRLRPISTEAGARELCIERLWLRLRLGLWWRLLLLLHLHEWVCFARLELIHTSSLTLLEAHLMRSLWKSKRLLLLLLPLTGFVTCTRYR